MRLTTLALMLSLSAYAQTPTDQPGLCQGARAGSEPKVNEDQTDFSVNSLLVAAEDLDPRSIATNIPCDHPFWQANDEIVGSLLIENDTRQKVQLTVLIEARQVLSEHSQSATWNLLSGAQLIFVDVTAKRIVHVFAEVADGAVAHLQIYLDEKRVSSQCQGTYFAIDRERYGRFKLSLTTERMCRSDDIRLHPRYRRKGTPLHMTKHP